MAKESPSASITVRVVSVQPSSFWYCPTHKTDFPSPLSGKVRPVILKLRPFPPSRSHINTTPQEAPDRRVAWSGGGVRRLAEP